MTGHRLAVHNEKGEYVFAENWNVASFRFL